MQKKKMVGLLRYKIMVSALQIKIKIKSLVFLNVYILERNMKDLALDLLIVKK
jgi:hypothetical protein